MQVLALLFLAAVLGSRAAEVQPPAVVQVLLLLLLQVGGVHWHRQQGTDQHSTA